MTISKIKLSTDHVLKGLDDLRDRKLLCDVHLVAEGAKFPAHRVVLAAASPYFMAMFTGGFKENQMNEITLNDTTFQGLKCVLDAIYTGELSLSEENVCDVLPVASQMQLNEIVGHCGSFLLTNVSVKNCLSFLYAAEKYDLQEAVDKCNAFVLENFDAISQLPEYKNLSKEQLCNYLSEDLLKTCNGEIDVYRATLKWFEANRGDKGSDKDSPDLVDLMQHVRFPLIPNDTLLEEVLTNGLILSNAKMINMVREAIQFHGNLFAQPLQEGKQFQARVEEMLALVYSKGRRVEQSYEIDETKLHMIRVTGSRPFQNEFSEQEFPIAPFPMTVLPRSLSVLTKGKYLFLFGADAKYSRAIAQRFDVRTNKWMDLKPPPLKASEGMAATLLKGSVYLCGGSPLFRDGQNPTSSVNLLASALQYSIEHNSWSEQENLPRPLAFHSAASHGNYVFCAGGSSQDSKETDKVNAFDVVGKIWLSRASMNCKRVFFRMEAVGAKLVACGGLRSPNVEIYNIANDQWTLIQNGNLDHHFHCATVVLNDKVYVIGGSCKNANGGMTTTDYVSCIDADNATIRRVSKLPIRVCGHSCAMLTAPITTLPQ